MEKYAINISNSWSIENLKNIDKDTTLDKIKIELPFGQYEFYEGEINWLLDPLPLYDFNIDTCREIEVFNKKASFRVLLLKSDSSTKEDKWKEVDSFEGSFVEALEYIQQEFNDKSQDEQ